MEIRSEDAMREFRGRLVDNRHIKVFIYTHTSFITASDLVLTGTKAEFTHCTILKSSDHRCVHITRRSGVHSVTEP